MKKNRTLEEIADEKWLEMTQTLEEKGADFAFDIFMDALKEARFT